MRLLCANFMRKGKDSMKQKRKLILTITVLTLLTLATACNDNHDPRRMSTGTIDMLEIEQLSIWTNDHISLISAAEMEKKPKNENLLTYEEYRSKGGDRTDGYAATTTISDKSVSIGGGLRPESYMDLYMPVSYHGDVKIEGYSIGISLDTDKHFFNKLFITGYKPRIYSPYHYNLCSTDLYLSLDVGELRAEKMEFTSFDTGISCDRIIAGNAKISTLEGDILIEGFCGAGSIVSEGGDITVYITEINGNMQIESTGGEIRIYMDPSLDNYEITAASETGSVANILSKHENVPGDKHLISIKNKYGSIQIAPIKNGGKDVEKESAE